VYRFFPRWIHKYIFITTIFIALLMTLGFFQSFLVDIDLASSRSTGDLSGRLDFWNIAIKYIAEHPIAGIGIGSFTVLNPFSVGAHNIMLTLALDLGIIGAAIFIWFLFLLLYPGIKSKSTMANRYIAGLFMAYWTPIAFSGHIELSPFSWLVLAITHNLIREEVN
jgi:O-antigen ligase